MSIFQYLEQNYKIDKQVIINLKINPDKEWGKIELDELYLISEHLGICIKELV